MAVNKVELASGEVLVDLTEDTVTSDTLAEGYTAHDASGEMIVGTMTGGNVPSDPVMLFQGTASDPYCTDVTGGWNLQTGGTYYNQSGTSTKF